ncbi:MAG: hypothetical protein HUU55_15580 [Myxococcales bacterium]|nr:hypothetical protein [Myxococcales bacterium]
MKVQTEIRIGVGVLVVLQFLLALGAIGLLARMSPAVDDVVRENVVSVHSVEDMLGALLYDGGVAERIDEFTSALNRAKANITEDNERPVLEAVEELSHRYFAGDGAVLNDLVGRLKQLGDINRQAIGEASTTVRGTGVAGTWAAVLLALFGFGLSIVLVRRMTRRILWPLHELRETVAGYVRGNTMRRCIVMPAAAELGEVARGLNAVLDGIVLQSKTYSGAADPRGQDRAVLLELLDHHEVPTAIVDGAGTVVVANQSAQQILTGSQSAETAVLLANVVQGNLSDSVVVVQPISRATPPLWMIQWNAFAGGMRRPVI